MKTLAIVFAMMVASATACAAQGYTMRCDSPEYRDSLGLWYSMYSPRVYHEHLDSVGLEVDVRYVDVEDIGSALNEGATGDRARSVPRPTGRVVYQCKTCNAKLYGKWRPVHRDGRGWRTSYPFETRKR